MAHVIILEGIEDLAGSDPGGCLGTLKGHMPAVEDIEKVPPEERSFAQSEVMFQVDVIAEKFDTEGFRPNEICGDTAALGLLIAAL